jgi:hypothetical protein
MDDFIAWHYNTKGIFSVKSTYKVCIDDEQESYGSSDDITIHHPTIGTTFPRQKIWELQCPHKVKKIAWRLHIIVYQLREGLNLGGLIWTLNVRCACRLDEDAGHLLFKCKYARHVWQQLEMEDM